MEDNPKSRNRTTALKELRLWMDATINNIVKLDLQKGLLTPIVKTDGCLYVCEGYKLISSNTSGQT